MRFGTVRLVMLAAFLISSFPTFAHAQAALQKGTWLASGGAGLALDSDANASFAVNVAAAFPLNAQLAVEGELGHVLDLAPDDANVDASMTTAHGNVLYLFNTSYVLSPYVTGGLGVGKFSVNTPAGDGSRNEFGFNLGAGVFYPLSSGTSIRGDFRYFKHIDDLPSVWRFTGGVVVRIGA
jgi:opacity protein-like surface antigen